jgi:hypothetical protein
MYEYILFCCFSTQEFHQHSNSHNFLCVEQQTIGLSVPKDSPLAQHHYRKELEEKEELKRLVMQYAESVEEENKTQTEEKKVSNFFELNVFNFRYQYPYSSISKQSRKRGTSSNQQQPVIDLRRAQQLERDDDSETQVIILAGSSRGSKERDVR